MTEPNAGPTRRFGKLDARWLGAVGVLLLVQAVFAAAFVLPQHKPQAHDVPVGLVGPAKVGQAFEKARPGALSIHRYASEADAEQAIRDRNVYGALITGPQPELLIASGASASVAQRLTAAAQREEPGITVRDLAPLADEDPRGSTINLLFFPLIITCFISVALLGGLGLSAGRELAAVATFAALGGLAVIAFVSQGLDAIPGDYLELSAVAALIMAAIALPTAALARLLGKWGVGLAFIGFMLIGNPGSGNGTAPELLPGFWRAISQWMPPGAGGSGLRNTAYFDAHATLKPLLVLGGYALAGACLLLCADAIRRRVRQEDQREDRPPLTTGDPIAQV
jgi:hypothetical protein